MLEDILRQIRTLLQNQLPGKLDQIELERADGVTLEDIQSFFTQPQRDGRVRYPSITIIGEAATATNALSRRRELRHKISVWVTSREVSPDSELAQTKLRRYVEAIERILASDPTQGGIAIDSVISSHVYPFKGEEEFIRRAVLIIEVMERP
ncbi:MAG: hypothetical protein Q6354_04565, partial [Candidatus Brocadiales bacterium]|nr:hypothetical protein [Candidatus Brocadiales bacterium]